MLLSFLGVLLCVRRFRRSLLGCLHNRLGRLERFLGFVQSLLRFECALFRVVRSQPFVRPYLTPPPGITPLIGHHVWSVELPPIRSTG